MHDIDLEASYAYSDSATDLPMLEVVGHPVAVNPDRELARVARDRGWEVRQFRNGVPLRERVNMPPPRTTAFGAAGLLIVVAAGGAAWWLWRTRRPRPAPPSPVDQVTATIEQLRRVGAGVVAVGSDGDQRDQASCSFFTAKAARATTTMRTRSFFMRRSLGPGGALLSRAICRPALR